MKIESGYYVAYRTEGAGSQLRLLSRRFPVEHENFSPSMMRQVAEDWMKWERTQNPSKDVVLIQVIETN